MKKIFLITMLLSLTACGGKTLSAYDALMERAATKRVNYACNYDRIGKADFAKFGDYCKTADKADYVSYYIPADIQTTKGFTTYLSQTAAAIQASDKPDRLKYFHIYADNYAALGKYQINNSLNRSFAAIYEGIFFLSLSAEDLLPRQNIYPSLLISSYDTDTITYSVGPKAFAISVKDAKLAELLTAAKAEPAQYAAELKKYQASLGGYPEYTAEKLSPLDYAIPQAGLNKLDNSSQAALLHSYLPSYTLKKIDVMLIKAKGDETLLTSFTDDEILWTVISQMPNAALFYSGRLAEGEKIALRFTHLAEKPAQSNLDEKNSQKLGIDMIYEEMQKYIDTWLYVDKFFDLKTLNAACASQDKAESLASLGIKASKPALCTPVTASIIAQFNKIEEVLKD